MKPGAEIEKRGGQTLLLVHGDWTAHHMDVLDRLCTGLEKNPERLHLQGLDLGGIGALDTTGAFLINRMRTVDRPVKDAAASSPPFLLPLRSATSEQMSLIKLVLSEKETQATETKKPLHHNILAKWTLGPVNRLGASICLLGTAILDRMAFFGAFMVSLGRSLFRPANFRLTSTVYHMEQAGVKAIPIVSLLVFLIGTVLAYMIAGQLASFGAEIFVVKLLEVGILRELGVLITSILVAGRSGSSYTAQIGSMIANQEVDAMRSMGIDPMNTLVVPRILALVIMLPALVLISDLAGILGGLCAIWLSFGITPQVFIETLQKGIRFDNVLVGLIKAPFFALVIGGIGCFTGFRAGSSADSVGRMTTRAVVEAIFLVIALDAIFALFFNAIGF